jgi:hypothetical protein
MVDFKQKMAKDKTSVPETSVTETVTTEAVVETGQKEIAVMNYGDYANAGFDNQSKDDVSLPFLGIVQTTSPQLDLLPNAKPGQIINTVTQDLYDGKTGIKFVPGTTQHLYVEWVPRTAGGGFVGTHKPDSDVITKAQEKATAWNELKNGNNDLVETFYIFGVMLDDEDTPLGMAVLSFSSTKIKVYKRINTKLRTFQLPLANGRKVVPPLFAHRLKISTIKEKSTKGDFYNFSIEPANGDIRESLLPVDHPAFLAAKTCGELVAKGAVKADEGANHTNKPDGEVPF